MLSDSMHTVKYRITKISKVIKGEIILPSSKSISNRILIIRALARKHFEIHNLSYNEDTKNLLKFLDSQNNTFNVGDAGTTMRFLTSYLANKPGEWTLTGSDRMKNRPIGILVNALKQLGVRIEYLEKEGFPPIKIYGTNLKGGKVEISGSISSQFISSLLLIAPTLPNGLDIRLKSNLVSKPYIDMTLNLMRKFGVKSQWEGNNIVIKKQNYKAKDFIIEADWTAASYWYEMAALAADADVKLYGIKRNSIQGDSALAGIFKNLGIKTTFIPGGIRIRKTNNGIIKKYENNFTDNPDIIQTLIVTLCILHIPFSLNGIETFILKESNRVQALKKELFKIGCNLMITNNAISFYNSGSSEKESSKAWEFNTAGDHRITLSLTPLALLNEIIINNVTTIKKSYPGFWEDIQKVGFEIQETE